MSMLDFLVNNTRYSQALCEMTIRMLDHNVKHYNKNPNYYSGAIVKLFTDMELLAYVAPITGGLRVTVCDAGMTNEISVDMYISLLN